MGQATNGILFYGYCWSSDADALETFGVEDTWDLSEEAKERFGVEVSTHCSCDCPMFYIFISETEITARRGSPQRIYMEHPHGQHAWDVKLQEFIEHYKVNMEDDEPEGPGWFLVSDWC